MLFVAILAAAAAPPHLISIVVDDLGFHDTQLHNNRSFMTSHFGDLANAGITLDRHHTYMYCSPTRRSFLSGRFPAHITGQQPAGTCSNLLPLNFTLLPGKLKQAGYQAHMVG
jgi:arylsulfatase A-like enzyme